MIETGRRGREYEGGADKLNKEGSSSFVLSRKGEVVPLLLVVAGVVEERHR